MTLYFIIFSQFIFSVPTLSEVDTMYGPFISAKWLVPLIADASLRCGLREDVTRVEKNIKK